MLMVERPFIEIVMNPDDPLRRVQELQKRANHVLEKIGSKKELLTERELGDAILLRTFDNDFSAISKNAITFKKSKMDPKDIDTDSLTMVKKLEEKILPILNRYLDS